MDDDVKSEVDGGMTEDEVKKIPFWTRFRNWFYAHKVTVIIICILALIFVLITLGLGLGVIYVFWGPISHTMNRASYSIQKSYVGARYSEKSGEYNRVIDIQFKYLSDKESSNYMKDYDDIMQIIGQFPNIKGMVGIMVEKYKKYSQKYEFSLDNLKFNEEQIRSSLMTNKEIDSKLLPKFVDENTELIYAIKFLFIFLTIQGYTCELYDSHKEIPFQLLGDLKKIPETAWTKEDIQNKKNLINNTREIYKMVLYLNEAGRDLHNMINQSEAGDPFKDILINDQMKEIYGELKEVQARSDNIIKDVYMPQQSKTNEEALAAVTKWKEGWAKKYMVESMSVINTLREKKRKYDAIVITKDSTSKDKEEKAKYKLDLGELGRLKTYNLAQLIVDPFIRSEAIAYASNSKYALPEKAKAVIDNIKMLDRYTSIYKRYVFTGKKIDKANIDKMIQKYAKIDDDAVKLNEVTKKKIGESSSMIPIKPFEGSNEVREKFDKIAKEAGISEEMLVDSDVPPLEETEPSMFVVGNPENPIDIKYQGPKRKRRHLKLKK